jgi:hypothetical protein|tara:strand:- start:306 stop:518 length:213 start_codon:yes stop_codon:yes gene_type:complete
MTRYKLRNGVRIQFTAEEETARDAEEAQAVIDQQAEEDAEIAKEANKASTKAKLEALGLTTDEVKDTFGL